jgi:subtilisin family serine protease
MDNWFALYRSSNKRIFADKLEYVTKVKIAVLDTGIDQTHGYIQRHWKPGSGDRGFDRYRDFTTGADAFTPPQDTCGHGTHCAGILLRLAPYAELYVARVFADAEMRNEATLDAVDRVVKVSTPSFIVFVADHTGLRPWISASMTGTSM